MNMGRKISYCKHAHNNLPTEISPYKVVAGILDFSTRIHIILLQFSMKNTNLEQLQSNPFKPTTPTTLWPAVVVIAPTHPRVSSCLEGEAAGIGKGGGVAGLLTKAMDFGLWGILI